MSLEPMTETPSMAYVPIARENWEAYFDTVTKVLEGREVEIEVAGLEFGDQIQAEWLPLNGLSYDRKADAFYVYVESIDRDLGHAIVHPREIFVRQGAGGLEQVVVSDSDGDKHIIRLRQPLELPEPLG
jgi:hypothetical protein